MRVLVLGAQGNIGRRLVHIFSAQHEVTGIDIADLDMTQFDAVNDYIGQLRPDLVVHSAGMTNVDQCAEQPEQALRVNGYGTQNVALACQKYEAALCYLSTNEVFDGERGTPYMEYDPARPINPYGYSKWIGEQMVRDVLPRHYIVRTSWVFAHGGQNFAQKILARAMAGQSLAVVTSEVACPTYAEDLAEAIVALTVTGRYGVYHLINEGRASRYDFARHILDTFGFADTPIEAIIGAQFNRPSRPPAYSVLQNFVAAQMGIRLRPWREAVVAFAERERLRTPES